MYWKTLKNESTPGKPGKIMECYCTEIMKYCVEGSTWNLEKDFSPGLQWLTTVIISETSLILLDTPVLVRKTVAVVSRLRV